MQKDKTSHLLCKKSYISVNSRSQATNSTVPGPLLHNIMDYLNGSFCFFPLFLWLYPVQGQELEEFTTVCRQHSFYSTCPRVSSLEHEPLPRMFHHPLKGSAQLRESQQGTIKTVQMKHHSQEHSGPQSKGNNINTLSNNNTCNQPRQLSANCLPTKSTKQENKNRKNHSEISETQQMKVTFHCTDCTGLIFNHTSSSFLQQQHPDFSHPHTVSLQLLTAHRPHSMWCLHGLKSTESLFLELTGQEKPWVIFTVIIYIVLHNVSLQQLRVQSIEERS